MVQESIPKLYDLAYKSFFHHPIMVVSLFEEFVNKDFVSTLDFSTLQRLPGDYVQKFRERQDDVVWRINRKDSSSCYITVILEFQRTPDPFMAVRIQTYSMLLLSDIIDREHLHKGDLPPVFPVVLYNGKTPWNEPLNTEPLFSSMSDDLKEYSPSQKYFLLDESHMPEEELSKANGLAAQLIKLEQAHTIEQIKPIIKRLKELLKDPALAPLNKLFASWLDLAFKRSKITKEIHQCNTLQEVDNMLLENAANWKNEYIQEGRTEGRKEGEAIGCGRILQILLEDRFGTIPDSVSSFIASSDSEALTSLFRFANKAPSMQAITDHISRAQAPA